LNHPVNQDQAETREPKGIYTIVDLTVWGPARQRPATLEG
jgi:hypothetical protein